MVSEPSTRRKEEVYNEKMLCAIEYTASCGLTL